ncbi:MAG: alpha/beta hydrolase [Chloroflexi bacterium]|nr:alpha/beta hydrolase [Chloroflexota bacterium]
MNTPVDAYVTVNGLQLHVRDWGGPANGHAPVLMLHGLASNARIWDWVAPLLAQSVRVVALDQRSHGLSQPPADFDFSFDAICADMRDVISALGFERPALVGHSWGANAVVEFAARHPETLSGAVMVDGGMAPMSKRLTWEEAESRLAPPRLAGTPLKQFREMVKEFAGEMDSEVLWQIILGNFEILPDDTIRPHLPFDSHMKILRALWEQNVEQLFSQVKCPALFLPCIPPQSAGEGDMQYLQSKREGAAQAQRLMPQARVEWLTDSIHDVPLQRPERVAALSGEFVNRL